MTDVDEMHRRLDALAARVRALETDRPETEPTDETEDPDDTFWALTGLRGRRPGHPSTADGAVMIVGSLDLPTGETVAWQEGAGTTGLLDVDWTDLADALAALGHTVRLELLRQILSGVRTTAELVATDHLGTPGQLHHHLRQLKAAGWVQQSGRGSYEVPTARIVPLLTTVVGARR